MQFFFYLSLQDKIQKLTSFWTPNSLKLHSAGQNLEQFCNFVEHKTHDNDHIN